MLLFLSTNNLYLCYVSPVVSNELQLLKCYNYASKLTIVKN